MLTIHHLENSRSQRVLWLLEELGVPYEVRRYERGPDLRAPAALRKIHPLGKSPILVEGDLTLAETGAIIAYILQVHGRGRFVPPEGGPDWWRYQHFLHYAEGSAMPPLLMKLVFARIPRSVPTILRPLLGRVMQKVDQRFVAPQLATHFDYWDAALARTGWFAGPEFSAADVMMSFPVEAAGARVGFGMRANPPAFLARIHARPAFQRALERGGPYAYA